MIVTNYEGYIDGTTSNENIVARLKYGAFHYQGSNRSAVYTELYYKRTNEGFTTYGTGTFSVHIYDPVTGAEQTKTVTATVSITEDAWVKVAEFPAIYVSHAEDGTGTALIGAAGSISGTTLTKTLLSDTVSLGTIPRATSIDSVSCDTSYFTGTLTYKYTPKSDAFYNRCNISLNLDGTYHAVKSINIGKKAASQQTATVTLSSTELSTVYNLLPSATSGKLRFTFRTYSDSGYTTEISGGGGYKEISLTIPNDTTTQPTMTMTLAPVNDSSSLGTLYAKGISKVKATFTNGAGKYGASVKSYKMTVSGKDYASPYTSAYLTTVGSITVKGTVTDSRGYSRAYTQNITVLDYTTPSLDSLSCSSSYFNGTITHKYTPPNNTFYTRCLVTLGSTTIKAETHARASGQQTVKFSFTESELSKIYNALPNSASGKLTFTFQAFTDSGYTKQIGSDSTKEITLSIPNIDATQPTATLTHTPLSSLDYRFNSLYIKGKTKAVVDLTNRAGKYGATIKSYKVTVGAQSGTPPFTSQYISTSNAITVKGTVTDSRGFSRTYSQTITPIDYSLPRLLPVSGESGVVAARCNSAGTLDANGTYLKIKAKRSYSKVESSGSQKNFCQIQYRYKAEGGSYSSWTVILATTASSDEIVTGALLSGGLSTTATYVVQVQAIDDIGENATTTIVIASEKVYRHKAGSMNAYALGKYAEEMNTFDVAEDWRSIFRGSVELKGGYVPIEIPQYSDFNNLTTPNIYYSRYTYVPEFVNCPITVQTTFALEVIAMGKDGQLLQRVTRCSADATVYERQYYSSTWHEWECVNPPMVVGEEYRTTERYMGKPVYTKLIYCDVLPDTANKLFPHGATSVKQVIRCVGQMSDGNSIPFRFNATNFVEIYAGPEYVVIYAGNDKTNRSAYAQMWYIKD